MASWALMILAFAMAAYGLWNGVVNGLIRRRLRDPERPEGWSGSEAAILGLWLSLLSLGAAAMGVGAAVNVVQGGGDIRFDSLPMVFIGFVMPAFGLLAGIPMMVLAVRTRTARWGIFGSLSSLVFLALLLAMVMRWHT